MNKIHTHYDNLRVSRNAPAEVIRAAYRTLAQKYHPDKNPGDPDAARITVLLNASYEVLMDPEKRKRHDEWISAQGHLNADVGPSSRAQGFHSQAPRPQEYVQHSLTDVAKAHPFLAALLMIFGFSMLLKGIVGGAADDGAPSSPPLVAPSEHTASPPPVQPESSIAPETYHPSISREFRPPKLSQWNKLNAQMSTLDIEKLLGPPKSVTNDDGLLVLLYSNMGFGGPWVAIKNDHAYFWGGYAGASPGAGVSPVSGRITTGNCQSSDHQSLPAKSFSGYISGKPVTHTGGLSTFTVDNTQISQDVLVKLIEVGDSRAARTFQVKGNSRFTLRNLSTGRYKLMYRHRDSCKSTLADDTFALKEEAVDGGNRYSNVRVTLHEVQNGNLHTSKIAPSEFDQY